MRFKVAGELRLWDWIYFKEEIDGKIVDRETNGNYIYWIEFETNKDMDFVEKALNKYNLSMVKKWV